MTVTAQPQWIARMYRGKTGRDHLGLGSVSSAQILMALSPGVNVLTTHPRYYSFYSFLLDEFWRRDLVRTRRSLAQFYRPRAFIFSVGAHLCDRPEHGKMEKIMGGQKVSPLVSQNLEAYETNFQYIKSDLGGFGLYYRTVMAEIGLVYPGGRGMPYPIDVPTEKGKEVAEAFRQAVANTTYYQDYFDHPELDVPTNVALEYIRQACLCQLQVESAPDRPLLLDAYLHGGNESNAVARRATFRLLLDVADQTQGYHITEVDFRLLLYFGETYEGAAFVPREGNTSTHIRWRLYQAREYYAFALNAMWHYLCDWGIWNGGDAQPLPLERLWEAVSDGLDFSQLANELDVNDPGLDSASQFGSLLQWVRSTVGTDEDAFDQHCTLAAPLQEHRLYELAMENRNIPHIMIGGMVTMLTLIICRFGHRYVWEQKEWEISRMGSDGRLSVHQFLLTINRLLRDDQITIGQITRWLFEDYIILQHQLVATSKLPDNTFRYRREGKRLRFFSLDNRLAFMDSRFNALSTTVHELGLCGDFRLTEHPLTHDGQHLLEEGDLV